MSPALRFVICLFALVPLGALGQEVPLHTQAAPATAPAPNPATDPILAEPHAAHAHQAPADVDDAEPSAPGAESGTSAASGGGMMAGRGAGTGGRGMGRHGMGGHGGGQGGGGHGGGHAGKHQDVVRRLEMLEVRMAKIEAMLDILLRR